jgi:ATP-dependent Lon protease
MVQVADSSPAASTLPILPLRDVVVFPHMMMPFVVGRASSVRALEHALMADKRIFLATQRDAAVEDPGPEDIYAMGCVADVVQSLKLPDGSIKVLVEGVGRATTVEWKKEAEFYRVVVKVLPEAEKPAGAESAMSHVVSLFERYVKLSNNLECDAMIAAVRVDDPGKLGDTIAAHLLVGVEEKQSLLEIVSPIDRLGRIAAILERETSKLDLDRRIESRVRKQIGKKRTERYNAERKKAIQQEIDELKEQLGKKSGREAEARVIDELNRLAAMSLEPETYKSREARAEATRGRSSEHIDVQEMRKVLQESLFKDLDTRVHRLEGRLQARTREQAAAPTQDPSIEKSDQERRRELVKLAFRSGLLGGLVSSLALIGVGWLLGLLQ